MKNQESLSKAQDALNRMKKAFEDNKGCYLTKGMIKHLALSVIGEMWTEDDPRGK